MSRTQWTPDNDQLLFFLTLATANVKIDPHAIERAWPQDRTPKPSARAIQERFVKIRKIAVSLGAGDFSIGGGAIGGGGGFKGKNGKGGPAVKGKTKTGMSFTTARKRTSTAVKEETEVDDGGEDGGWEDDEEARKGDKKGGAKKRKLGVAAVEDGDDEEAGKASARSRSVREKVNRTAHDADDDEEGDGIVDIDGDEDSGDEYAEEV